MYVTVIITIGISQDIELNSEINITIIVLDHELYVGQYYKIKEKKNVV